jgi:hypothetical protein
MVGENAIAFSCSEAGNFHLATRVTDFFGPQELLCSLMVPPQGGWFAHSGPTKTGCRPGVIEGLKVGRHLMHGPCLVGDFVALGDSRLNL